MEDNKLITVQKTGFFEKVKMFFKKIFNKPLKETNYDEIKINQQGFSKEEKQNFLNQYQDIKNGEQDINSLDDETLKKMILLAYEELEIKSNKAKEELKMLRIQLDNLIINTKELELSKKNS